jgi:hypothetical protein
MSRHRATWLVDFSARRLANKFILWRNGVRIVSYPRSGRTWLRMMLHELSADPRFNHAGSQWKLQLGPDKICERIPNFAGRRVLFLLREPRDTVVSLYHHYTTEKGWKGDFAGFVRGPTTGIERLLAFNLGWLEAQARFRGFTAVRYEDLRADPKNELWRIINFMGCKVRDPRDYESAAASQSFDRMQDRERSGELRAQFGDRFPGGGAEANKMIVRRGVIGGYADEMAEAERQFCEEHIARLDYFARIDRLLAQAAGPSPPKT